MMANALMILIGFATGIAVSAGVFAFIAAIGIVPRMAQRTLTQGYIHFYEDVILLGGLFGTLAMFVDFSFPPVSLLVIILFFANGIFVGVLFMALAEVLNVMPILMRRGRMTVGLTWLLVAFALGKMMGSLLYFLVDGFYVL